ncbi:hypothetical protein AVEN_154355-1 [Araneus ventricosus]|uniref:Uncharacterized protein n=1 Tax=Araneus ventricosus TaxID=182803 RepID=A0A4Y2SNZ4_ARAVE|nr:hypothetical protein AVEN_154355-1 [Araneus ventricosus]
MQRKAYLSGRLSRSSVAGFSPAFVKIKSAPMFADCHLSFILSNEHGSRNGNLPREVKKTQTSGGTKRQTARAPPKKPRSFPRAPLSREGKQRHDDEIA